MNPQKNIAIKKWKRKKRQQKVVFRLYCFLVPRVEFALSSVWYTAGRFEYCRIHFWTLRTVLRTPWSVLRTFYTDRGRGHPTRPPSAAPQPTRWLKEMDLSDAKPLPASATCARTAALRGAAEFVPIIAPKHPMLTLYIAI